eukprot:CAMPEP_0171983480 /NCGR_PEP_ID=MMETSP0993-20121228/273326_1 /TAXON_ID=483369 /ORGANISM="non described non described, Strain CCMP2098" /LENGTH=229 /DNA_ID=CAMNT_0012636253 /DNA_START=348 /DNA_END=1037 /DNA_ORIENTATION=+
MTRDQVVAFRRMSPLGVAAEYVVTHFQFDTGQAPTLLDFSPNLFQTVELAVVGSVLVTRRPTAGRRILFTTARAVLAMTRDQAVGTLKRLVKKHHKTVVDVRKLTRLENRACMDVDPRTSSTQPASSLSFSSPTPSFTSPSISAASSRVANMDVDAGASSTSSTASSACSFNSPSTSSAYSPPICRPDIVSFSQRYLYDIADCLPIVPNMPRRKLPMLMAALTSSFIRE